MLKMVKISKSLFRYFLAWINQIEHEESKNLSSELQDYRRLKNGLNCTNLSYDFLRKSLCLKSQNFKVIILPEKTKLWLEIFCLLRIFVSLWYFNNFKFDFEIFILFLKILIKEFVFLNDFNIFEWYYCFNHCVNWLNIILMNLRNTFWQTRTILKIDFRFFYFFFWLVTIKKKNHQTKFWKKKFLEPFLPRIKRKISSKSF